MAALGQLTAGIAHEINNPLNYMTQSVTILEEDFTDLKKITKKYDALLHKIPEDEKLFSAIKKHKQSTREIDTVYTDIEDSLRVISEGIEKTANISKGLTTYSRMDSTAYKRVSVEKNLEATIQLLKHEFNAKDILLERDYARPSKKVDCNPGQLNQVFTNLLNNAIYAIKHREKPSEKGCIRIITQVNPNYFVVTIRDNGMGMSAKTLSKIYDPFFTTKDVGEGTGLGLSISYGIIRNHQGSIQVDSTLNKGTSFRISLPISFQKNTQSNEEND
jgi:signal transduction histidine kinase